MILQPICFTTRIQGHGFPEIVANGEPVIVHGGYFPAVIRAEPGESDRVG